MKTLLLISPYWKEDHRWMVSSFKLAELWQRLGYRVVVCCMGSENSVVEESPTLTIHRRKDVFLPDPFNYGIALGFTGYVRKVIKREKPDLIIANKVLFWTSLSVIALRVTGHKVLLLTDVLGGMTWWPRGRFPKVAMAVLAWTVGLLVMWSSSRIVLFHPQPENLLRKLGVSKKTQVIPTGIDVAGYKLKVTGSHPGTTCNMQPATCTVTYIGRLESVKGVDDFLAATAPLKSSYPDLNIQVVGWYREGHPLVEKYQRDVIFTGLRDDISEILQETDIFVLPSYSEGLSNALMEAMASSVACIATEVGGNRFLIQNGVSGFLYAPGDREELQSHIRRLIEDSTKREMVGKEGRKRIEEVFDWKVVGKQYQDLFREILG